MYLLALAQRSRHCAISLVIESEHWRECGRTSGYTALVRQTPETKLFLSWAEEDADDVDVWRIVRECAIRARVAMATDAELAPKLRMLRATWIISMI